MSETGKPDYGYDAPYALWAFAGLGALATGGAVAAALVSRRAATAVWLALYGAFFLGNALVFLHTTRRGKFRVWQAILDNLNLHGHEKVVEKGWGGGGGGSGGGP